MDTRTLEGSPEPSVKTGEPSRTRRLPLENLGKHLHADKQKLQRFRDENNSASWRHEKPSVTWAHFLGRAG